MITNEIYNKYVTEDLKKYKGLSHPVDSLAIYRIKNHNMDPKKLHPNPEDEFSESNIGPNWNIISDYEKTILHRKKKNLDLFDDPLIAVRLDKGGFMLLNGHHRWMAALNLRLDKVPVKVVNITHEEDIIQAMNKSSRNKCVTIDFDEVLFSDAFQNDDNSIGFPLNYIYKNNIRECSSYLIREFQRIGFDVWIYTGSYLSRQYIKGLFSINKCKVDGIVNGINGKRNSQNMKSLFREKYDYIAHVSNDMISIVNTKSKNFETIELNVPVNEWASAAVNSVEHFDMNSI